ncbi:hypothetical protein ACFVJM_26070 [Streptomyces virginiae]|uniref:hypothetical protein n=1 Tax=Streptomyces virginiae TaxID=1961 RepID=UPI003639C4D2
MSDDVLSIIPTDAGWQPDRAAADRALVLVERLTPGVVDGVDVEIDMTWHDAVTAVDARFEIAVWNPERLWFDDAELAAVAEALGHAVRQVRARL